MNKQLSINGQAVPATEVKDIFWEDENGTEIHWTDDNKSSWQAVEYFYVETEDSMLEVEVTDLDADTMDYIDRMVNPL